MRSYCRSVQLLVILFSWIQSSTSTAMESMYFEDIVMRDTVIRGESLSNSFVYSSAHCCLVCVSTPACLSLFYNNVTGECVLHETRLRPYLNHTAEHNWQYFIAYNQSTSLREFQGHIYFFPYDVLRAWAYSKSICEHLGANLVQINSQEEQDWLKNEISTDVWIGLNDVNNEGEFVWTGSREGVSYFNWGFNEPGNTPEENCVLLMTSGDWNNVPGTESHQFVCER